MWQVEGLRSCSDHKVHSAVRRAERDEAPQAMVTGAPPLPTGQELTDAPAAKKGSGAAPRKGSGTAALKGLRNSALKGPRHSAATRRGCRRRTAAADTARETTLAHPLMPRLVADAQGGGCEPRAGRVPAVAAAVLSRL
eukprot:190057-Chlamydomonas_euryale.AAC.1